MIHLEVIESTNMYAKSNIEILVDKTVIHADRQTGGHGRLQRSWVDLGKGNLFVSIVLKPSSTYNEVYSNLTQYLSVVLCLLLEEYGLKPQIKWPNDVLINGKKIAGILSESVIQGNNFKGLILGIGVNLNSTEESLSKVTDKEITSLNIELNKTIYSKTFLSQLLESFFANYDKFLENGFEMIKKDYVSRASFLDKEICVQIFKEKISGIARSITDKGELVLSQNGKKIILTMGDII